MGCRNTTTEHDRRSMPGPPGAGGTSAFPRSWRCPPCSTCRWPASDCSSLERAARRRPVLAGGAQRVRPGGAGPGAARPGRAGRRRCGGHRLVPPVGRRLTGRLRPERRRHREQRAVTSCDATPARCSTERIPEHPRRQRRLAARRQRLLVHRVSARATSTTATSASTASARRAPTIRSCSTGCPTPRRGPTSRSATTAAGCSCR